MKTHSCYRLSDDAIAIIKTLSKEKGISMAAVVELAVRAMFKQERTHDEATPRIALEKL